METRALPSEGTDRSRLDFLVIGVEIYLGTSIHIYLEPEPRTHESLHARRTYSSDSCVNHCHHFDLKLVARSPLRNLPLVSCHPPEHIQ